MTTPSWISTLSDSVLRTDMASAAADGVISEAEITKAFTDLVNELTSTAKTLTSAQLNDLRTIVADLNNGIATSSYVAYVTNALVNGNAANAKWTGGAGSAVTLGNLAGGSSATQLSRLEGKWLLGTDLPCSVVSMSGASTFTVSYSAQSGSLFASSGPSMNDVNQGYLGDCYLLSSLAEVAKQDPSLIQSMITSNGNGTYGVRFYVKGQVDWVTVNGALADGGSKFNHGSNLWASLVEKAYAQLQAGGVVTGNSVNYGNSWSTIGNGGWAENALAEITGASQVIDYSGSGSSWNRCVYNNSMAYQGVTSGLSTASVLSSIVSALGSGYDAVLSSWTNATDSSGRRTLVADHAMSVIGYDSATGNLIIRNPWGTAAGQYWDTTFEVSLATLLKDGDTISVANAGGGPSPSPTPSYSVPMLIQQTSNQSETVGQTFSFSVASGTFVDPQGSALTYSATLSGGGALPSWLHFNAGTDTFSGTPTSAGTTTVCLTATDAYGLKTSESFSFIAGAPATGTGPVLVHQTGNQTWTLGQTVSFALPAGTFTDTQAMSYSAYQLIYSGDVSASWLHFNASTQTFSGTVAGNETGSLHLLVVAIDSTGKQAYDYFDVSFKNSQGITVGVSSVLPGMDNHGHTLTQQLAAS